MDVCLQSTYFKVQRDLSQIRLQVSVFSLGARAGRGLCESCTHIPRRRPAPFAVAMETSSNDVSIPRGGAGARGVAPLHPPAPCTPAPLHPCTPASHRPSTVGPCKMTDVKFGYTYYLLGRKLHFH